MSQCRHEAWERIGNANRCVEPSCRAWLTDMTPPASTPAPACACDMRTRLVGDGCDVCNQPAPAWQWSQPGDMDPGESAASFEIGPFVVQAYSREGRWFGESYATSGGTTFGRVGPYPTAPEAARAAVEALRAIVEPVVEALDRVPELETP